MRGGDEQPLAPNIIAATADGGAIVENIIRFTRTLRDAGLPIGPERTVLATQSVLTTGLTSLPVFHAALRTSLIARHEHHDLFDEAFQLFWKEPASLANTATGTPELEDQSTRDTREVTRRLLDSLLKGNPPTSPPRQDELEIDARETFSAEEIFRQKDFDQMSAGELADARRAISRIPLLTEQIATRRYRPAARGERIDLRAIFRQMAAVGADHILISRKGRVLRPVPIVVLVDISGSMDTYARMMLHFLYALINASSRTRPKTHAFLFGTRLTNITRLLAARDPDVAIDAVTRSVADWAGGTRIGESIATFNRLWARRVLGQNATVLLVTDGLDREGADSLELAVRRLRGSCRRLVWLNPLLRYDGYQPLARGAQALDRHVSIRRACHNLQSLQDLATSLGAARQSRDVVRT